MKLMLIVLFASFAVSTSPWLTNFEEAKKMAHQKHQFILLNFSGSDWCGPCIRLHKEIFESEAFNNLTSEQLVLVNADFPRMKKNQLPKAQQQQNDKLADTYNAAGNFPLTVLLNAEGKVIKEWEGFPKKGAASFIDELTLAIHADK